MNPEMDTNDTIRKMIDYMKPSVNKLIEDMEAERSENVSSDSNKTPLKRAASSDRSFTSENATPLKKFKADNRNFDVDYIGSPREMRRLRSDLIEARNTILNLENRISHLHGIRKEMQVLFDNESASFKRQRDNDRKSILELENQLQSIRKREQDLKQELAKAKNKFNVLKLSTDQRIEELEKRLCDISTDHKVQEGEENAEIASLRREILELQSNAEAAEDDADALQNVMERLEKEEKEKNSITMELEMKNKEILKLKLRIKEFEYIKENHLEYQEQAKTQARKLAQFNDLEKENEKLKEENYRIKDEIKNKLLLEEEVNDLKTRLAKFKGLESRMGDVEEQLTQANVYLNEWRAIARGILENSSVNDSALPYLMRTMVERLQQQELSLTDEKVSLQSNLNSAIHEAKVAKDELLKNQKLITEFKETDEKRKELIHRLKKRLLLVTRERDSYRRQLDSYEKDLTVNLGTSMLGTQAANQVQSYKERIENLEQIVNGYRDVVTKLEADLQNVEKDESDLPPIKLEQISRLQSEIEKLRHENDLLRERKDQLEIRMEEYLVGNDTLKGGQVYHLANNPLAECIAQREAHVEKLEEEVDRLKKKLKNMEEGIESSKLIDMSMSTKEVQILREEIKKHELQTQHWKDYFKSSMQEFRDVVYMLLGYKIDKSSKSMYKLINVYAENANDVLCFQLNGSSGDLNLLETDFSSRLEDLIEIHLRHQNSIPNFLSSLTLNLYANRTMITEQLEINDD